MGTSADFEMRMLPLWQRLKRRANTLVELLPKRKCIGVAVERSVAIGQKATATVLVVDGERLLLGVTAHSVNLLKEWKKGNVELSIRGVVR